MEIGGFSVKRQWQLQLALSALLFLAVSSPGFSYETRKSGRSSVFSLFNLKEKSRFWSENVIHSDFDDLTSSSPDKASALNYTIAGNIANYLKLQEVDAIHLPDLKGRDTKNSSFSQKKLSAGLQKLITSLNIHGFDMKKC
ncbi:hypothetical protein Ahy_B05g074541 [Arachis hypogaea]|uniref:Uncharacterized protein n=1 Tax=Arachis hypogaea TaxID=3818 RepID=A0A444YZ64_ARAHY|nr:hypothetical protein Ahy_B05g074541 [Arachis hypogaea]